LNKQDLNDIIGFDEIQTNFNLGNFEKVDLIKTIAINGDGILDSFKKMLEFIFPSIIIKGK